MSESTKRIIVQDCVLFRGTVAYGFAKGQIIEKSKVDPEVYKTLKAQGLAEKIKPDAEANPEPKKGE